jgi:hypothetical protein
MPMLLSQIEEELLADLSRHAHGLWEIFEFVSLHAPVFSDGEVLEAGRDVLASWSTRGWLEVIAASGQPLAGIDIVAMIDALGDTALVPSPAVPRFGLSAKAYKDVDWLTARREELLKIQ